MATYTVQAPDGHTVTLQGPDGASHDEVIAQAQKLYQPKGATPTQQPTHGQVAGLPNLGGFVNSALAGDLQFTHNIPLVGDTMLTAARYAHDALIEKKPTSWSQANAEVHQILGDAAAQHPVSSAVGGAAGAVDSAVLGGAALKAAGGGVAALNAIPKGPALQTAARLAAAGATAGATQGAAQAAGEDIAGGNLPDNGHMAKAALGGAVGGAVLGPVVGGLAHGLGGVEATPTPGIRPPQLSPVAGKLNASLSGKTAQALSKVFGEDPADLQAAWSTFKANTGRAPTMAELATLKQRGEIAGAAKNSQAITATLTQAADDAARARSDNLQQVVQQGGPVESSGQAQNATTAQGDIDYPAARQHDFTISTADSDALGGVSPTDHLAAEIVPLAGLKTSDRVRIVEGLKTGKLSGQDAQMLRSKLAAAQGAGSSYSPAIASAREDLDEFLAAPGNEAASQALAKANENFAAGAQRAAGAAHGETVLGAQTADNFTAEAAAKPNSNDNFKSGMASGARSKLADTAATPQGAEALAGRLATDDSLHAKLATALGQDTADALRRLGESESAAAENMNALSRRTPPSADAQDGADAAIALRGLAAAASHGPYMAFHGSKFIGALRLRMSPQVQETVAKYLSDPKLTQQGINLLKKAGATNAQLRQLALSAATGSGALAGSAAADVTDKSHVSP